MASEKTESIQRIVQEDLRYGPQAYYFIFDALDFTLSRMDRARHVTGPELLKGIRGQGDSYQPNLSSTLVPALLVEGLVISS